MKYSIQVLEITLIIILLALSIITFRAIRITDQELGTSIEVAEFHIAVVSDHLDNYASELFMKGITESVLKNNCVLDLYNVKDYDLDTLQKVIIATKVNGVIVNLENNIQATELIKSIQSEGIIVLAAGNDAPESGRALYIGTNKYALGRQAGKLAVDALKNSGQIAVILGSEYELDQNLQSNNFVNGIYETFQDLALFELVSIQYSRESRAEILIDELLRSKPNISAVICTDPIDAVRVTRVLVDRNIVGDVKVIASGDPPEVLDAIRKDLIYASFVEDNEELGNIAVTYLVQLLSGENISNYVNIPIKIINKYSLLDAEE